MFDSPFLSSMVTVSLAHFIKNLSAPSQSASAPLRLGCCDAAGQAFIHAGERKLSTRRPSCGLARGEGVGQGIKKGGRGLTGRASSCRTRKPHSRVGIYAEGGG